MNIKEVMQKLQKREITLEEAKRFLKELQTQPVDGELTIQQIEDYIKEKMAHVLRIDKDELLLNEHVDNFGVDSIQSVKIVKELEKDLSYLPKTLFFEYTTIHQLAQYLLVEKKEELTKAIIADSKESKVTVTTGQEIPKSIEIRPEKNRGDEIAIIGLAGKYPKSNTLQELWDNLLEHSVTHNFYLTYLLPPHST